MNLFFFNKSKVLLFLLISFVLVTTTNASESGGNTNLSNTADSIYTLAISGSPFCELTSYSVVVNFRIVGSFTGFYTAELSDASGSFANPVAIGSGPASPIYANIPAASVPGTGYRIRVKNNSPALNGEDNGTNLAINNCNPILIGNLTKTTFCASTGYTVNVPFTFTGNLSGPFKVELSDFSGSFANANVIGYGASSPVFVEIPSGTPSGNGYRIRIVDYQSGTTGSDNGVNLSINNCTNAIPSYSSNSNVRIYPNPSNGNFFLYTEYDGSIKMEIYSPSGKLLKSSTAICVAGKTVPLNWEEAETGVYFVKIITGDKVVVSKLVIEK